MILCLLFQESFLIPTTLLLCLLIVINFSNYVLLIWFCSSSYFGGYDLVGVNLFITLLAAHYLSD